MILAGYGHLNAVSAVLGDFQLTERETEILKLLVDGFSYKSIAAKCTISTGTVNSHISHIYEKLQVNSMAGAVSVALREGLV